MPVYARAGVGYAWLVDPRVRTVEVFELGAAKWSLIGTWTGGLARLQPFDAIELDLDTLWAR